MGCLLIISAFAGPRLGIFIWWLFNPDRFDRAFDTIIWPALAFIFLPWTMLAFVAVAPTGNVADWDYLWLALAFSLDLFSWVGEGGYGRKYSPY